MYSYHGYITSIVTWKPRFAHQMETDFFDIVAGVLNGDTLSLYLFIICLDYVLWTSIDLMKENGFTLKIARSRWYPAETITDTDYANDTLQKLLQTEYADDTLQILLQTQTMQMTPCRNYYRHRLCKWHLAETITDRLCRWHPAETITDTDYADDIVLFALTPTQAKSPQQSLEQEAECIGLHVNADKTDYMCFNQGDISTLNDTSLKLVYKFTYLSSSVSSTESDINMHLVKARTAIDSLSIIWKSDLSDGIKWLCEYGCIPWTLTKHIEKKLDCNSITILRAILNKSRK